MYKPATAKNHQNTRDLDGRIATGFSRRMTPSRIDFAVLGASPQARLIAGLLAGNHKKSVIYQGESQSGYRLPRGIDLSTAPITRPETWARLGEGTPELRKLIARIGGRNGMSRVDPIFQAHTAAGMDVVGHIRHMAQAFDVSAERVPRHLLSTGHQGVLFRDAFLLHRASLEPVLDRWLSSLGVQRLEMNAQLRLRPDGSAEAFLADQQFEIAQTVLADDQAIITHLPAEAWPASITAQTASSLLLEPSRPLATTLRHQLDHGITLTHHARGGILAMGSGTIEQVSEATQSLVGNDHNMRQAGQSSYQRIATRDGAPVVGRLGGTGLDIIAGFGTTGAFFATALARWLAGVASEAENTWFAARLVDRDSVNSVVADWGAMG
ncbi:hypothetical protein [Devosia naphthalenivorans]|uniref:hypothetical protein n=1 Tax=Devosia naphthalenivorans TaxID=2082392 RepID=UPI001964D4D3|nr:hypothetical protein [Devosia naphthalenivorans]